MEAEEERMLQHKEARKAVSLAETAPPRTPAKHYNFSHYLEGDSDDPNYTLAARVTDALTGVEVKMELFSRNMSLLQGHLGTQPGSQEGAMTVWNRLSELGDLFGHMQRSFSRPRLLFTLLRHCIQIIA